MASLKFLFLVSIFLFSMFTLTRVISQSPHVCDPSSLAKMGLNIADLSFCDQSHSFAERVKDLVDTMTLAEKVAQLGNSAQGVSRLGLPPYQWWSEALHGVSNVGPGARYDDRVPASTIFPMPILTSAAFNQDLWKSIAEAISTEARAMNNLGLAGLTYWSPTINVAREPRWGRIGETPGEDPFVVGTYAASFVRGLQDIKGKENSTDLNSRPLKVSACCKHYTAYDTEYDRWHFNSKVTERDLIETYNRPFEMCVREGDASGVMCTYNRVDGIPSCADPKLLSDTIRGEWNLNGYIVSDCNSIQVMQQGHQFLNDAPEDAVRQVLRAGLDLNCGDYYSKFLVPAINQGKVREDDVDKALRNIYQVLMRVGYFDGSPEFKSLGKADVCSQQHIDLAYDAARQGIVLLKNKDNILPLDPKKHRNLAVVGPHATSRWYMLGTYAGVPCRFIHPADGLAKYASVNFQRGCENVACHSDKFIFPAMQASQQSDATVIVVGYDISIEVDGRDRDDLFLPGFQPRLITQVADAAHGPTIVVIIGAGPVDITFAKNHPKVSAIIWAGYPAGEGGRAIADVIYGQYNPGGRLPVTWYPNDYVSKISKRSMELRPDNDLVYPGRTYRFYDGPTVYPFGYGLSYSQYSYKLLSAVRSIETELNPFQHCHVMQYKPNVYVPSCPAVRVSDLECKDTIDFEVEVHNTGNLDGSHVVMVYSIPPPEYVGTPLKQLVGFQRVPVHARGSAKVKFSLNTCNALNLVTETAYTVLPSGNHTISIGDGKGAVTFPAQVTFHFL